MTVKTNIKLVGADLIKNLSKLNNAEYMLRSVAFDVIDKMTKRIHINGIASDGSRIGDYSPGYMKVRTGNFGNTGTFKKGQKKGQKKNAGVFTRGKNKGAARPLYNRGTDTKIIVSLTRQLENDWAVIAIDDKSYGIGFNNPLNLQKARWVEEGQDKLIFDLTQDESDFVDQEIAKKIDAVFGGKS